jgi:hypothetical protein
LTGDDDDNGNTSEWPESTQTRRDRINLTLQF